MPVDLQLVFQIPSCCFMLGPFCEASQNMVNLRYLSKNQLFSWLVHITTDSKRLKQLQKNLTKVGPEKSQHCPPLMRDQALGYSWIMLNSCSVSCDETDPFAIIFSEKSRPLLAFSIWQSTFRIKPWRNALNQWHFPYFVKLEIYEKGTVFPFCKVARSVRSIEFQSTGIQLLGGVITQVVYKPAD